MTIKKVWDPLVRLSHWAVALLIAGNIFFVDDESKLHRWVGYAVAGIILGRVLWGFIGRNYARFATFPPSLQASLEQLADMASGRRTVHMGHTPLGALMIYNLWTSILVICLSGYLMTTDMFWGVEWPEELHEIAVTWVEISVAVHVAAVVIESIRTKVNLPRAMITGYKRLP
jgi:cytochrome b